jgi:hypothetical protein
MHVNPIGTDDMRDIHDTLTSDPAVVKFIFAEILKLINIDGRLCVISIF